MEEPPIPLEPKNDPFQHALANTARIILKRLLHFETLPSTNSYTKDRGAQGEQEGLIVLADKQTGGLGRLNRSWHSPPGGLYFSVLFRPKVISPAEAPLITLTAGVAVAKVLQTAYGVDASLKWPNDVLIENQKVAGILSESALLGEDIEYVVVGIGVNANSTLEDFPKQLHPIATTLHEVLNRNIDLPRLFSYLIGQLEYWYLRLLDKGFHAIAPHWRKLCSHLGKKVNVSIGKTQLIGIAKDISSDGSLILKTPSDQIHIHVGEVTTPIKFQEN